MCRGFALVGLGQQVEGIAQLRIGLVAWNGVGNRLLDPQWLGYTAEAYLCANQLDDALSALDRAAAAGARGRRRPLLQRVAACRLHSLPQLGRAHAVAAVENANRRVPVGVEHRSEMRLACALMLLSIRSARAPGRS